MKVCKKKSFDKIKAMLIIANAQKKLKKTLIEKKLGFIFVKIAMLTT
jgi:hypothetical protein